MLPAAQPARRATVDSRPVDDPRKDQRPNGIARIHDADAERYTARGGWGPRPYNLASEAINSGSYTPVDEAEAERVMNAMHRRIGD
jgi:hypothetical protein